MSDKISDRPGSSIKRKKYSRLEITNAGRNRLKNKRAKAGGVDAGITQEGLNWAAMAGGPKQASYDADRKAMLQAERKVSYKAGQKMDMDAYSATNKKRRSDRIKESTILRERGTPGKKSSGIKPHDTTSPSNWGAIQDFFRNDADKKYTTMDIKDSKGILKDTYLGTRKLRTTFTPEEQRRRRLQRKDRIRAEAAKHAKMDH